MVKKVNSLNFISQLSVYSHKNESVNLLHSIAYKLIKPLSNCSLLLCNAVINIGYRSTCMYIYACNLFKNHILGNQGI